MKKILLTFFMASLAALTVHSQTGIILELSGEVELKFAESSIFVPARSGSQINQDTIISTGFRSTAKIAVGNSIITIRPLTRLSLPEIQNYEGMERFGIDLHTGRIVVDVNPPDGTKINAAVNGSGTAVLSRGTIFEMDTNNINVIEGRLIWKGLDGVPVSVSRGHSSTISIDGSARNPVQIYIEGLTPSAPVGTGLAGEKSISNNRLFFTGVLPEETAGINVE